MPSEGDPETEQAVLPTVTPAQTSTASKQNLNASYRTSPTASSHRHSRSKSVNLSPTLHSNPSSGMVRWDLLQQDLGTSSSSQSNSSQSSGSSPVVASQSPRLRPTSPIYINVNSLTGVQSEPNTRSPVPGGSSPSNSSGSWGSDLGTSPETRRLPHFARAMEKSSSSGSLSPHPQSPRSPRTRRTSSPSRVYALPASPRLQALGSTRHGRQLSNNGNDPIVRIPSPLMGASSGRSLSPSASFDPYKPVRGINPDPELPVDSVWPSQESHLPTTPSGAETIPIGHSATKTTPIPPSLRDDLSHTSNGISSVPLPGPASGIRRSPSPSIEASFSAHGNGPGLALTSHGPTLAAPQPIARNLMGLTNQAMQRHRRTLSGSSSDSDDVNEHGPQPDQSQYSPTHKVMSRPQGPQAKVDAQHVIAETTRTTNYPPRSDSKSPVDIRSAPLAIRTDGRKTPDIQIQSPTWDKIRGIERRSSFERLSPITATRTSPFLPTATLPDAHTLRSTSPALRGSTPPTISESPPKVRSFIGMPPRSGYDLSDDPDDVGSEDGSVGSGRDSVGTDEEKDEEDEEDGPLDDATRYASEESQLEVSGQLEDDTKDGEEHREHMDSRQMGGLRMDDYEASHETGELHGNAMENGLHDTASQDQQEELMQDGIDSHDFDQLAEEGLSTLERIFLFAKSEMTYHRVLVSHSLADWVMEVELNEAVEFVIPLLNGLACDTNEVCVSFAPQLHRVMWHFFRNCPLSELQHMHPTQATEKEEATRPFLSVAIFTPLLCALLLNSNAAIANATQSSIVFFCARLQGVSLVGDTFEPDDEEVTAQQPSAFFDTKTQDRRPFDSESAYIKDAASREDKRIMLEEYHFSDAAREMVLEEILRNVGIAIGHLSGEDQQAMEKEVDGADQSTMSVDTNARPSEADELSSADHQEEQQASAESFENGMMIDPQIDPSYWTQGDLESGTGPDSAMLSGTSMDGNSVTMSMEEEVAVGRMASISLLAALGGEDLVPRTFLQNDILSEMLALADDKTFFVRKEAAVSIGMLAQNIGQEQIEKHDILSVLLRLCQDNIWHVRQAACLSVPNLFAQIADSTTRRTKMVDVMRMFVTDSSRNVRVAALDIIGEVIYLFHEDPEGVPRQLIRHFLGQPFDTEENALANESNRIAPSDSHARKESQEQLYDHLDTESSWNDSNNGDMDPHTTWSTDGNSYSSHYNQAFDPDSDRPLVMAYNLPAVVLTLGPDQWHELQPLHSRLCHHPSSKVRRSLAASLHEVAKIIGPEAAADDLLPLGKKFIDSKHEQDNEVKMALLEHIDILLEQVSLERGLDTVKLLHSLWFDDLPGDIPAGFSTNWRLREKVMSKVPNLARRFLLEDDQGYLVLLVQASIVDGVSAVRSEAVKSVSTLYQLFEEHDQVLADGFLGMLVDLAENQESYRARVATLQCIGELCKASLQRSSIEMLVMPRLLELSRDEIVDVRIAMAYLVTLMCRIDQLYALPQARSDPFRTLLHRLVHDPSPFVRNIVSVAIPVGDPILISKGSPQPERPRRVLVLGPADGGPHKPEQDPTTMDGENSGRRFDMEEGDDQLMDTERQSAPSLANSTLAQRRRRLFAQNPVTSQDSDWSMFEDADEDYVERHSGTRSDGRGSGDDDDDDDEEMIVIPSDENALLLSTDQEGSHDHVLSTPFNSAIGDDSEDDVPHHLLSISEDSPNRLNVSNHSASFHFTADAPALESPERPYSFDKNHVQSSTPNGAQGKTPDPFLAFVAGNHHDWKGSSSGSSEK